LKWSYSLHTAMRRCQLQLVFGHRFASHNARDPERREAYVLKQLQHVSAWQGHVVHHVMATDFLSAVTRGDPIDPTVLTTASVALARRQFAFSGAKRYREPGQTKSAAGEEYSALFAHEYGWPADSEVLDQVEMNLARCFANLAAQPEFLDQLRAGSRYAAELPLNIRLDGVTVAATPDLVFIRSNGQPTIVDWKIAQSETSDYSRQLLVYALVVSRCGRWPGVRPDEIELIEANLLKNEIRRHPVSAQSLDDTEDFIYRSVIELKTLMEDVNPAVLDLADFDVAEQPSTCLYCGFRGICVRWLDAAGTLEATAAVQGRLW